MEYRPMKHGIRYLAVTVLLLASAAIGAQSSTEPLSGLPVPPGFKRTADPVDSYKYCGKSAQVAVYVGDGFADEQHEKAWFAHAVPGAISFAAVGDVTTFVTPDGTAAVETGDAFIFYFRFSPGLSPAEIKIFQAAPAARACTPS
jgi:hypothetical protein